MSWRRFGQRKRRDEELARELESYLAHEEGEKVDAGLSPEEARSAALRKLGNATSIREEVYRMNTVGFIDAMWQDVRYALRTLHRTPVFSLAAIVTLALGIGANTAIFSVVRAVLLKSLPYENPERIVVLEPFHKNTGKTGNVVSAPDFHDWRGQNRVFEYLAYHNGGEGTAIINGVPSFAQAERVTPDFFAVFGLPPAAGRFWSEQENRTPLAVLSYAWAQDRFGDVRTAIGRTIRVYGRTVEVAGVAFPGFRYPGTTDVWISAGLFSENRYRSAHNYFAIGKLKAEVSLTEARREMWAIGDRLEQQYKENRFKTVAVTPLAEKLTKSAENTLLVLFGAVVGVLLIACANVANLQLARAASRSREMAMRAALGASRRRILRQVLTESIVLGGIGMVMGLGLGSVLLMALLAIAPSDIPRLDEVRIDGPVLLFTLTMSVACSILFGLMPARRSADRDVNSGLRQGGAKGSIGRVTTRARSVLVVAQVAVSMILLAGAGLLLRSFLELTRVDLGFSTGRLLLTHTSIPVSGEAEARRATEFQRDLIERIGTLPGVRRAAGVRTIPFAARRSTAQYWIEGGRQYRPGETPSAPMQVVTPGYFETMDIPFFRGRDFTGADSWGRPQVAIINETLAREAFGEENPLGRRIRCGMSLQSVNGMEIVGVVKDARQIAPGEPPRPELFMPYLQHPIPVSSLVVRTRLDAHLLAAAIRQTARDMNPEMPVRFSTMDEIVGQSLAYPRFRAMLTGCFAILAACLAIVGIYSVISYVVGQRTNEIGLRFALGARPADVFRLVIGGSMRLVMWGLALGLIGTLALARFLQTFLFGVGPHDPFTIAAVLGTLGLAALLGSIVPALRAARVDPLVALRQE